MQVTTVINEEQPGRTGQRLHIIVALTLIVTFALAYFLWPGFGAGVRHIVNLLGHADLEGLRVYILSFGAWAPVVSFLIMLLQAVVAPLPAFLIALANGLLFGAFWGTVLTWSSATVGAVICFYLARALGRPMVMRLVSQKALNSVDLFFKRYGNNSVLIARLIPLISPSAISYAAGTTCITFRGFMLATAVGLIPGTIVFSVLGQNMTNLTRFMFYAVTGIAALIVLGLTVKAFLNRRLLSKKTAFCVPPETVSSPGEPPG